MDQPYRFGADLLSKFHTASEPIQALWILALAVVFLGTLRTLTIPLRLWLAQRPARPATITPRGELLYGVYRDAEGRWLVYAEGEVRVLDEGSVARLEGRVSL
jgi:hypothetical protein